MMVLKKIGINILLVAITVALLDFTIGLVMNKYYFKAVSGENYRTTYAMEETNAEILIFGSSQAKYHYIPTIFQDSLDLSCYNTGKNHSVLLYQNVILKSVLKRYVPKVIILDYSGGVEEEKGAYDNLSSVTPYYKSHKEVRDEIRLKGTFERIKLLSSIYPYNSEVYRIFRNTAFSEKRKTLNGHVPMLAYLQEEMDTIQGVQRYTHDKNLTKATKDFLSIAREAGSKVIVISSPIYLNFEQKQEIEFMRGLCKEQEIPFWDFSKDTLFLNNKKYFNDWIHLNQEGAIIFSKIVAEKLKEELSE